MIDRKSSFPVARQGWRAAISSRIIGLCRWASVFKFHSVKASHGRGRGHGRAGGSFARGVCQPRSVLLSLMYILDPADARMNGDISARNAHRRQCAATPRARQCARRRAPLSLRVAVKSRRRVTSSCNGCQRVTAAKRGDDERESEREEKREEEREEERVSENYRRHISKLQSHSSGRFRTDHGLYTRESCPRRPRLAPIPVHSPELATRRRPVHMLWSAAQEADGRCCDQPRGLCARLVALSH